MSFTEQLKRRLGFDSTKDEVFYLKVVRELEGGIKRDGLWAKALAESDGDPDTAHAKYIRLRVLSLKEESVRERADNSKESKEQKSASGGVFLLIFSTIVLIAVISAIFSATFNQSKESSVGRLEWRSDGTVVYSSLEGQYVGQFINNKFNGQGTYNYVDGRTYKGEWKDDKFHGVGTLTHPDGKVETGRWESGKFLGP